MAEGHVLEGIVNRRWQRAMCSKASLIDDGRGPCARRPDEAASLRATDPQAAQKRGPFRAGGAPVTYIKRDFGTSTCVAYTQHTPHATCT